MRHAAFFNFRKQLWLFALFVVLPVLAVMLVPMQATFAANFTVNVKADVADLSPGNGSCDDGNGRCSLRAAIQEANALGGADVIDFSVSGTISFTSDLPNITSPITINGGGITLSGSSARRIFYIAGGRLTLNNVIISSGNAFMNYGGGIHNSSGTLSVNNSGFVSNVALFGGAIFNEGGTTTVTNTSFYNNTAMFSGSAIRNGSGTVTVTNSTIVQNTTGFEGASLSNSGTANVRNTIVYHNVGADCGGSINALNNLTEDGSCGAILTDNPQVVRFNLVYFALQPGSPAIDSGDNGVCPANDQRGAARPQDGDGDSSAVCDIGSYEADTVIFTDTPTPTETPIQVTDTPSPTDTPTNTPSYTPTSTPSYTPTDTATGTLLPTETPTATSTETLTSTPTDTPSPTTTPTFTLTSTPAPTETAPPPPPTPLCEDHNFDEGGVVRSSTRDGLDYAINCRVLYQNGQPTTWLGGNLYNAGSIGVEGIFDLGVQQAVDIFSPVGRTYFEGGAVFCLRGQGPLIWLAASGAPRHAEIIGSYTVDEFPGFTCATLFEPGTLVLVTHDPR